ncbi:MAG: hypothetical protein ACLU0Z_04275 [Oscillospiraceae bacterium]
MPSRRGKRIGADDSVNDLLFTVPAEDAPTVRCCISNRKTIEELSALLVRTQRNGRRRATPLCVLEETNADSTTTRVTVWRDGKRRDLLRSADAQSYRVRRRCEFCRLTGLPAN